MKFQQSLSFVIAAALTLGAGTVSAQTNGRPHFIPESITDFAAAYQKHHHRVLDPDHSDAHKYRAFRVATSGSSSAVTARSVTVDAAGHLHIIGEPGTLVKGQVSPGKGETHILLPISVTPPK
jgi:hypothetical protein